MEQLQVLDNDGKPPATRIKDAKAARDICNQLRLSDAMSAFARAKWQAMYDLVPPYSEAELQANGEGYRVNISWPFAPTLLETAQAGYVDIVNSTEVLFECPTTYGKPNEQEELERVVAEEVTETIRSWREFNTNFLQLTSIFIKEAVSVAMFRDQFDWRWDAYGMADFKIPRKTRIGQENIGVGYILRFYSAPELYHYIKDGKEAAEELGYNYDAIKKTIQKSVNNSNTFSQWRNYEWEKLEIELRNNDYYWTYGTATEENIRIFHMFWTEFPEEGSSGCGRTTSAMVCDDEDQEDFLYLNVGQYASNYEAYIVFTYGVGTNGFYHGIRGQGYAIYPIVQALNRAVCQTLELAMFGSAPIFQPNDESAMESMQFTPSSIYNLITPGINVIPNTMAPNLSTGLLPVIQQFSMLLKSTTASANTESVINDDREKTKFEVQAQLGSEAKLSVASMNLFYDPEETLFREKVKRMKRRDYAENESGGQYIVELHKRLLNRGKGDTKYLEAFFNLDTTRLRIKRAIGSGSEAARLLALDRVMSLFGSFDPTGQAMLLRTVVSSYLGWRETDKLVPPPTDAARPDIQTSIAEGQNFDLLSSGDPSVATVKPNDNQLVHAQVHLSRLIPMISQVEQGMQQNPLSLGPLLQGMNALNSHTAQHVSLLSRDPLFETQAAEMRKALNNADEIIHNSALSLAKLQRKAMEAQQQQQGQEGASQPQGQGPQIPPDILARIIGDTEMRRAKIENMQAETRAKIARDQALTSQKLALKDAETAQKIRQTR